MRIGVDGRHLFSGRGQARYVEEQLEALARAFPEDTLRIYRTRPKLRRIAFASGAFLGRPRFDRMAGGGFDVVWMPAPMPTALSPGVPFVLTVHDLSWETRKQDLTRAERLWHHAIHFDRLAGRADAIVTVSAPVRDELLATHPELDPGKVTAIRSGIRFPSGPPGPRPFARPYLLYVGGLDVRKQPDLLVRAHARSGVDADLVFVGGGPLEGTLTGPGVRVLGRVDDEELDTLYAHARALLLPSQLEGFGFTPYEALVRGTPAIVSDLPVLREGLGDAVTYVPPTDEEAWAAALLHEDLPAPPFAAPTWDDAARQLRAVFARVAR